MSNPKPGPKEDAFALVKPSSFSLVIMLSKKKKTDFNKYSKCLTTLLEKAYKDTDCEILLPSSDEHASRGKCLENGQRNPHNIWLVVGEAKLEKYTELNDVSNTPATFFF